MRTLIEFRTVLEFNDKKFTKSYIQKQLRRPIFNSCMGDLLYVNEIKVGMYTIVLVHPFDTPESWTQLRQYKDFQVLIYDKKDLKSTAILLNKDLRFKGQPWVDYNFFGRLRIKHLVDIIKHCNRLDQLKAFS